MSRGRVLGGATYSSAPSDSESTEPVAVDSDFVVILAALICALVCVVGLVAVARCAWLRRLSGPPPGLKKKVIRSLPKQTFTAEAPGDCAICLAEFAAGEEIRKLPQCAHSFHVACIDTWLASHSSCPSCRQILRCHNCANFPNHHAHSFLP